MRTFFKILAVLGCLHAPSTWAVLRTCHVWLAHAPLAVTDVGEGHTLVLTKEGALEYHDSETGSALRNPIPLGSATLRARFQPLTGTFSEDGSRVTLEFTGYGIKTFDTSSGLEITATARP